MPDDEAPRSAAPGTSAWAPLAGRVFRLLWIAQLASNLGTWMQTVGEQWLLVGHGALTVTLVQVAAGAPILLLALPAGVLADLTDRRRLLIGAQFAMAALAGCQAALALTGHLPPAALLGITFLLGCGSALNAPAWQAIQPGLVPRDLLAQASALGAVNMNTARAIGPALGGVLVAAAGAGWTFALNALSFLGIAAVLWRWRPAEPPPRAGQEREHVSAAMRAGSRYVRHAPRVRRILLRAALFVPGAAGMWALLPVVARQCLGLGSSGYGLLLGAVGLGAVGGAVLLPRVRRGQSAGRLLAGSGAAFAAVLATLAVTRSTVVAAAALVCAGVVWIVALSTLNASMQLTLPSWVRARGLAFYLAVFQGGQALGALGWGLVAAWAGLVPAMAGAAGFLLLGALSVRRWPPLDRIPPDPAPADAWPQPSLPAEPAPSGGPVLVLAEYTVEPSDAAAFRRAMSHVERSRRRTGATSWGLYQDAADPAHFVETFTVASWAEHLAQHHDRYTGLDHEFETRARRLLAGPPRITHALASPPSREPTSPRSSKESSP
ncbi:MFS transporter [Actinacidiphila acididurans]|uniref:MFS transporter n=1 Tax=Actinacidiphila acididurans TaxID=2784346 RepID=A0ABS2U5L0_9ACTN|nr:MFS transporter [Actinacidiphila acididurans]MBM9510307.1 MFS transporter [Actinacidiphila acididurans]